MSRDESIVWIELSVLDPSLGAGWTRLLEVVDEGVGGPPHESGRTGIRSDFMDIELEEYRSAAF